MDNSFSEHEPLDLASRVRAAWKILRGERASPIGPAIIEHADTYFGHSNDQFSPPEYGNYIATSNAVYTCATIRADLLSGLPLKLYKQGDGVDDREEVTGGRLRALLDRPNDFWTFDRLLEQTELSLCLWGQCFWFLERGPTGRATPREIWWGRPDRVKVIPHPNRYLSGFMYEPVDGSKPLAFLPGEVVWFRMANPVDEYAGLAPLAAARLAADLASSAMHSNNNLFRQGLQLGGMLLPKSPDTFSIEQARDLEKALDRRFSGVDKAHRWGVLRFEAQIAGTGLSPKDAEFLGALNWSLEEIARAFKIPLDYIGGQRTYENVDAALKDIWTRAIIPQTRNMQNEINLQLLPLFGGEADKAEFDLGSVSALQESEDASWTREREQILAGVLTINEWREKRGMERLEWGDVWWAPAGVKPIDSPEVAPLALPSPEEGDEGENTDEGDESQERAHGRARKATFVPIAYGSEEHQRLMRRFDRRVRRHEQELQRLLEELFRRQRDSVMDRLRSRQLEISEIQTRGEEDAAMNPFNQAHWIREFREAVRPVLREIAEDAGETAMDDIGVSIAFDVDNGEMRRFLEQRTQRFAERVNDTTWRQLQKAISEGVLAGEAIDELSDRVLDIMGTRIRSDSETIARTETIGAFNGGTLHSWAQSGVVEGKSWVAALDGRERESHREAHESSHRTPVPLGMDFQVGRGVGPHPGAIGVAEEDINCRCTMIPKLKEF